MLFREGHHDTAEKLKATPNVPLNNYEAQLVKKQAKFDTRQS